MSHCFVTSCIEADGEDINEMQDLAVDFSSSNFIYKIAKKLGIDQEIVDMLGYTSWAESSGSGAKKLFANDYALSCKSSFYQGVPCVYVEHSRIEYIFVDKKDMDKILDEDQIKERRNKIMELEEKWGEVSYDLRSSPIELKKGFVKFVTENKEDILKYRIPLKSFLYFRNEEYGYADKVEQALKKTEVAPTFER